MTLPRLVVVPLAIALLSGCAATTGSSDTGSTDTGSGSTSSGGTADGLVLPGTGSYAIGDEMPYGGYQLQGEPDEQPAGCTWAILDADGTASFENTGSYVFITDIPEAVTFETTGCPDWEQFE